MTVYDHLNKFSLMIGFRKEVPSQDDVYNLKDELKFSNFV